ncbi:putative glycoside hydrolase [Flammeovirga aprica]|uniref:Uncharacterized protein n=1 Tax=Flammeovirga aprica JL-4 TaxID=694437 RepID=A0A7X9P367_9BACT|nr:putative glycoside hydrolase [Flammeovirga aprica]NME68721.1 hypothetical protein [Flammeovirga aprica JL-4]
MKQLLLFLFCSFLTLSLSAENPPVKKAKPPRVMKHDWSRIPMFFHFGKPKDTLTEQEAEFVAQRTDIIALEKMHGYYKLKSTEKGTYLDAEKLKKYNKDAKVIFYWNTFLNYSFYDANATYDQHPEWWLRGLDGELDYKPHTKHLKRYDLSNEEVRKWWVSVAVEAMKNDCDGVFMDAFIQIISPANKKLWGEEKFNAIQDGLFSILEETREALGKDNIMICNGIRSLRGTTKGMEFVKYTDAVMIEHFGHFHSGSKEMLLADIKAVQEIGKQKKMALVKGWPNFSWIDKDVMKESFEHKKALAIEHLPFSLACFLMGANDYSYFSYSWGYEFKHGFQLQYDLLEKDTGKPLNEFTQKGWVLTREFEKVKVTVDLENRTSNFSWKQQ